MNIEGIARERSVKFSLHTFLFTRKYAPLAQLVEQLTLNQWVHGSSPWWCTRKDACEVRDDLTGETFKEHKPKVLLLWPVGQAAKTAASHAANGSSILPRVTKFLEERCWQQADGITKWVSAKAFLIYIRFLLNKSVRSAQVKFSLLTFLFTRK